MRKFLLAILISCFICVKFFAQDISGGDVKASFHRVGDYGVIYIENCTNDSLASLDIIATGENARFYNYDGEEWITYTFYNGRKYFTPPLPPKTTFKFNSNTVSIRRDMNYTSSWRNISINIGNPIFKK